jgi:hypothetical protein
VSSGRLIDWWQLNWRVTFWRKPPLQNKEGTYFSGIKIHNCLPTRIKLLSEDVNKFKLALKKFLFAGSFYSIEEFLHWSTLGDLNVMYLWWSLNWLDWVPYFILFYSILSYFITIFYFYVLFLYSILHYLLHPIPIVYCSQWFDKIFNLHIAPYFCPDDIVGIA